MTTVSIEEAGTKLSQLVDEAAHGEEVLITRNSEPVARIVPVTGNGSNMPRRPRGTAKGIILHMADDFDAPLEDFKEYME